MTWLVGGFAGGETRDALIEGCNTAGETVLFGDMDIISTPVKYGVGALRIPSGESGGASLLYPVGPTKIYCLEAWVNYNGNPTAAVSTIFHTGSAQYGAYTLEVNTSRQVRIGTLTNVFPATVAPLTDWSVGVLGNGSYTHLVWFFDPLTLGTNHTWHTVLIDNVPQICADLGVWPSVLDGSASSAYLLGTFVSVGVDLRLDDICGLSSTSIDDAPHKAQAPVVTVDAQHPAGEGTASQWTRNTGAGTWYSHWDDATGNDGDTTYLYVPQYGVSVSQNSAMESVATLGWNGSATVLESASGVGPVWSGVHRTTSTKWGAGASCNLGTVETIVKPGATYEGELLRITRAGGAHWARSDADSMIIGAGIDDMGVDGDWAMTSLMAQWCLCNNVYLPLTPPPMIPQSAIF